MMFRRIFNLSILLTMIFTSACLDDSYTRTDFGDADESLSESDGEADGEFQARGIAVVGSDYLSTSISIIDRERQALFRESVIHSGSAAPGLSIALSGDVVFPLKPDTNSDIVLIDRYPNSTLIFLDPADFSIKKQLSVACGFASNPHDYLRVGPEKAYVSRYEKNPNPGRNAFDEGDDILVINPLTYEITGSINLSKALVDIEGEAEFNVRPDRMIMGAGLVWVTCNHLSEDFNTSGKGLLLAIDPATDKVTDHVEFAEMSNCGGLAYDAKAASLYVSCTGVFSSGIQNQLEHSGLLALDLSTDKREYRIISYAADDQVRPFGFEIAAVEHDGLLAVRFGNIEMKLKDNLVMIDTEGTNIAVIHEASTPFGLGGFLYDEKSKTLYVGDANPAEPLIFLYKYSAGNFTFSEKISAHPKSGLPPRHIAFF